MDHPEFSMPPCIFCKLTLVPETKPEHILLDALGGRKTSCRIVCTVCNEKFGSGIDKELAESVQFIRNRMGFQSGSGSMPPAYSYKSPNGKVKIDGKGRPSASFKPFTQDHDGKVSSVTFNPQDPEAKEKAIGHAAAAEGIDPEELREKLNGGTATYTESFGFGPTDAIESSIGGRHAQRSIAKACMELLAVKVGAVSLLDSAFDGARTFILNDEEYGAWTIERDSRPLPTEAKLSEKYGPFFTHIQVSVFADGTVVGHFTLYNFVGWRIELARQSQLTECSIQLVCNPLNTSCWNCDDAALPPLEIDWLNKPSFDANACNARLALLFAYSAQKSSESEIGRICDEEFTHHGIVGDVVADDESVTESVIARIADRCAHLLTKSSYTDAMPFSEPKK